MIFFRKRSGREGVPMVEVALHERSDLQSKDVKALCLLMREAWPDKMPDIRGMVKGFRKNPVVEGERHIVLRYGGEPAGYARIFARDIYVGGTKRRIMALAAVCVAEKHRGRGFGKIVVRKALERVDAGEFEFSLFQTTLREFYEGFGARAIGNGFIDSRSNRRENIWWDPFVMIYPGACDLGDALIDLNGDAY